MNLVAPQLASTCFHREVKVADNKTICKKCGRKRITIKELGVDVFFYCNGVRYLHKRLK